MTLKIWRRDGGVVIISLRGDQNASDWVKEAMHIGGFWVLPLRDKFIPWHCISYIELER